MNGGCGSCSGEKSRNAEEMNKMNETVEQLRAQVASLQVQLAAAGGQAARPDSRGSGAVSAMQKRG